MRWENRGQSTFIDVVLIRCPSRAVFIEMMGSEDYARANTDRENALERIMVTVY